ncbi:MAG: hypothetical protein ACR5K7_03810 [Symbiopectobacterium sp.]
MKVEIATVILRVKVITAAKQPFTPLADDHLVNIGKKKLRTAIEALMQQYFQIEKGHIRCFFVEKIEGI